MSSMEEKSQELLEAMDNWFETIKSILNKKIEKQPLSKDASFVEEHSLEDLDAIIQGLIDVHMSKVNEHQLTLGQLNAWSRSEIDNRMRSFQNAFNIPLTNIPNLSSKLSVDWTNGIATLSNVGTVTLLGRPVNVPSSLTVTFPATNEFYINMNFTNHTGRLTARSCNLSTSTSTSTMTSIPVIKVNKSSKTTYGRNIVRIGSSELSTTPMGGGIPVSTGNQSLPGNINSNWYG